MEHSLSSLAFRGSIAEAIAEAKQQKKLFVVYTGGDNEESKVLETSTWINQSVSETVLKYCILLHLLEGSSEASNFSAIYPQTPAPCITVVGYNGVQLWQKAGSVSADVLASSLEKAWLSLHFQETTAAFLTAALASGTPKTSPSEQVTPETNAAMPSTDDNSQSLDAGKPSHSHTTEDSKDYEDDSKETYLKQDGTAFPERSANELVNGGADESTFITETRTVVQEPEEIGPKNAEAPSPGPEKNIDARAINLGSGDEVSGEIVDEAMETARVKDSEYPNKVEKADASDSFVSKSNDVFLNIKLPDGSSLRTKFSVTDTLGMIVDYIKETSGLSSFSTGIPYPRKIFSEQDLDRTLSDLGLFNRQALIVVPHNQSTSHYRGGSSDHQSNSSVETGSSDANEGYWAFARRMLSYVNPLSYLNRSPSSGIASQESDDGMWQYSPNPSLQNTVRYRGGQSLPTSGSNSNRRATSSRFGANIHTLKHDDTDDDGRFSDRNAFWNGNSTQYGGGNNDNDTK
ncbi:plant UBX domain-containing protein 11 [Andrographis paniculata]|uniref:plant UBX domain-containing protein 11 n=1 Tax=Andrographis paniculata TaxID=175694 RepID=UPI0021E87149|nr:plant UBX domain-containing protein 11 [Andrographis paniculata]